MKYTQQIFMALFCIFLTVNASATSVTKEKAAKVATNYLSGVVMSDGMTRAAVISESFDIKKEGVTVLYVFNFERSGYAIVSADDCFTPIVGYSPDGYYDQGNMPDGFEFLVEEFSNVIAFIQENDLAAEPQYAAQWERYADDNATDRGITEVTVAPMTALWNQESPYNYYTPTVNGSKTPAGCVATAMSMIMYYWRWPWQGVGEKKYVPEKCNGVQMEILEANFGETYYDYNGMYGTPALTADDYMYEPIALLQYHTGISVSMAYCPGGSGANSGTVPIAMKNYFKYDPSIKYIERKNYPNTDAWADLLKEQLDAKQPVYTSGHSPSGGHAFVCDGYNSDNMFHYNFGCSGQANGYFVADQPGEFKSNVGSVINFIPDRSQGYPIDCNGNWVLTHMRGMLADCSGPIDNYAPDVTATWLLDPTQYGDAVDYITITCNAIDLAAGDYLEIFDGENDEAPSLGKFTGSAAFETVTSTGGKVLVKFTSAADSETAKGFLITYKAKDTQHCKGDIYFTTPTGQFTDGSPEGVNYAANAVGCKWYIEPAGATLDTEITFEFLRLDTEAGKDEVKFFNYEGAKPIGSPISGSYGPDDELPIVVAKKAKGVMVTFSSNAFINGKGFEIKYSTVLVSIKEVENINDLSVYPNPASEKLNITFNTSTADDFNITIYNVTGQAVYKETLNNFVGSYHNEINVNDLAQGVYLMQVKSSKGATTQKIVVQ